MAMIGSLADRLCDFCNTQFAPTTSWQHYCSDRCRNKAAWQERKLGMLLLRKTLPKA